MKRYRINLLLAQTLFLLPLNAQPLKMEYRGAVDFSAIPNMERVTAAVADQEGGIYFVDNGTDRISYMPDPLQSLSQEGTSQEAKEAKASTIQLIAHREFATGSSWQNITSDGTFIYASGRSNTDPPQPIVVKIERKNDGSFIVDDIEGIEGNWSAFEAIAPRRLAAVDYLTGSVQSFSIEGNNASLLKTPILGSGPGFHTDLAYSIHDQRLYSAKPGSDVCGRVEYYTVGEQAGDLAFYSKNPIISGKDCNWTGNFDFVRYYSQIALSPNGRLLAVSTSQGKVTPGRSVVDIYYTGSNFQIPMITIDGTGTPTDRWPGTSDILGMTFFEKEEKLYFGVTARTGGYDFHVFELIGQAPGSIGW